MSDRKTIRGIGYDLCNRRNCKVLQRRREKAIRTTRLEQESPNLMDLILGHKIDLVIDTPPQGVSIRKTVRDPYEMPSRQVSMS